MGPAPWWQRGVIYQVYPRSFADSNGDGVGDLRGIVEHLDYLNDGTPSSLGVEAIWLSPFYRSPMVDFGYDVEDYTDVDPTFGTLGDFDRLLEEAHRRGIKVIVDWVPNHTSDRHPWFVESRSSRDNPKRDWYVWRDPGPGGRRPNNWDSAFEAIGAAWTFDPGTRQYYLHSFTPQQPDLNWENPEVEAAMHQTLRFWLERGVDGFRIDVIHKIAKDPNLGDNRSVMRHDADWPSIHERMRGIRRVVDRYPDRMIVGEVHVYDIGRIVRYLQSGDQLHLAHNFTFMYLPWDAATFKAAIEDFEALSAGRAWPAWFLGNHDHSRIVSRYGGDGCGAERGRIAAMLLYTLRGTPFIYQGDELGLPDTEIAADQVLDVDGRDPVRSPMPWAPPSKAGAGAGFTSAQPWLPAPQESERLNVESGTADPSSMLSLTRRLGWYRRRSRALQEGAQRSVETAPGVLAYLRESEDERLAVLLNFGSEPASGGQLSGRGTIELSTNTERDGERVDLPRLELGPWEGLVVKLD